MGITLGMANTPLTRALFEGKVIAKGLDLVCQSDFGGGLSNTGERHRRILAGQLDGGEFSTASFLLARARGVRIKALPVFLARGFRHAYLFAHDPSPIVWPSDLAGKRVTVHRYNSTTAVWAKGLLENQYGVSPRDINWYVAEDDLPGEGAPPGLTLNRISAPVTREHAVELLARGALDGALEPYVKPGPGIRRILTDYRAEAALYFRRTGVYPIIHTVALHESLLAEHPDIVPILLRAFRQSAECAPDYWSPQFGEELNWVRALIGLDPLAFRLGECERQTLTALSEYLVQQEVVDHPINVNEAFFDVD